MLVALSLAIIEATGSATDLGLVLTATALPRLSFTLVGGVLADRIRPQWVMLSADVLNFAVQVTIGVEMLRGIVSIGQLIVLSACSGTATAFFSPASGAIVPTTVGPAQLRDANALVGLSRQVATVIGPSLATALVVTAGPGWAFIGNAATYLASIVTLALLRVRHVPAERTGFLPELRQGWMELRARRWYWSSVVGHIGWNLGRSAYQTLGPLVAVRALGGAVAWGLITEAGAVGAVVGAVAAFRIRPRRPLVTANAALAFGGLPLLLLAAGAPAAAVAAAAALMYAGLTVMQVLWQTVVQQQVPQQVLSRVLAYDWLGSLAFTPLGLALAGPAAAAFGASLTLTVAAGLLLVGCLGLLAVPEVRRMAFAKPATADPETREQAV